MKSKQLKAREKVGERRKTRVTWSRLVSVLHLNGLEDGDSFLNQSRRLEKQNQYNRVTERWTGTHLEFCSVQSRLACIFDKVFEEELVLHDSLNRFNQVILNAKSIAETLGDFLNNRLKWK